MFRFPRLGTQEKGKYKEGSWLDVGKKYDVYIYDWNMVHIYSMYLSCIYKWCMYR